MNQLYKLIESDDAEELGKQVNEQLGYGWLLHGPPVVVFVHRDMHGDVLFHYVQALVK